MLVISDVIQMANELIIFCVNRLFVLCNQQKQTKCVKKWIIIIILYNKYIQIDQKHCVVTNNEFNGISQSVVYVSISNVYAYMYVCVCVGMCMLVIKRHITLILKSNTL